MPDSKAFQNQGKTSKGNSNTKQVISQNNSLERKQQVKQLKTSNNKKTINENSGAADVVLDLQRKKSVDFYPQYSKSTKVSPTIQS